MLRSAELNRHKKMGIKVPEGKEGSGEPLSDVLPLSHGSSTQGDADAASGSKPFPLTVQSLVAATFKVQKACYALEITE